MRCPAKCVYAAHSLRWIAFLRILVQLKKKKVAGKHSLAIWLTDWVHGMCLANVCRIFDVCSMCKWTLHSFTHERHCRIYECTYVGTLVHIRCAHIWVVCTRLQTRFTSFQLVQCNGSERAPQMSIKSIFRYIPCTELNATTTTNFYKYSAALH